MHSTTLTLLPFALVASLTLAAPWPNPFAQAPPPPPVCPPAPKGCTFPDNYTPAFLGYTGDFTGVGFPYYLKSSTQGLVCPGRLDDTVRRALQIPKVGNNAADYIKNGGDTQDVKDCPDSQYPILQVRVLTSSPCEVCSLLTYGAGRVGLLWLTLVIASLGHHVHWQPAGLCHLGPGQQRQSPGWQRHILRRFVAAIRYDRVF
ncbi:hypothetical protein IWX49DRAFT_359870 [Phyllosticta citricarpa]|uniref:Uncharacterized protein n=2 Tax=Phyllosticta TaxID=121621 RepID=A0ABR1L651_9PEZI